jgi:hypothetical protein
MRTVYDSGRVTSSHADELLPALRAQFGPGAKVTSVALTKAGRLWRKKKGAKGGPHSVRIVVEVPA